MSNKQTPLLSREWDNSKSYSVNSKAITHRYCKRRKRQSTSFSLSFLTGKTLHQRRLIDSTLRDKSRAERPSTRMDSRTEICIFHSKINKLRRRPMNSYLVTINNCKLYSMSMIIQLIYKSQTHTNKRSLVRNSITKRSRCSRLNVQAKRSWSILWSSRFLSK